jgi:hypothetical protein
MFKPKKPLSKKELLKKKAQRAALVIECIVVAFAFAAFQNSDKFAITEQPINYMSFEPETIDVYVVEAKPLQEQAQQDDLGSFINTLSYSN